MIDPDIQWPDTPFDLQKHAQIIVRRGSESHGLYIPSTDPNSIDDRDLMVAAIPPPKLYLGLSQWEHAEAIKGPWDTVIYEWRKVIGLLTKQNPNVMSLLWSDPEDYLYVTDIGRKLIDNRLKFQSRHAAFSSFMGYAESQLKKMTSGAFKGYMGDKRKKLVEKHGFDTKNGAHLIRLLHMGNEYLRTGVLNVRRTWDKEMLLDIKQGRWSLEQVQEYAADYFGVCRTSMHSSCLPESVDLEWVNEFIVETIQASWADLENP